MKDNAERTFEHRVQVYYEDTDHSGVVYHANYLKYFERAREHALGIEALRRLMEEEGMGFVVYKAEITYKEGAVFADTLLIKSRLRLESAYRCIFEQDAHREADDRLLVASTIQLVCVGPDRTLVPIPQAVAATIR